MKTVKQIIIQHPSYSIHQLYDKYSGMLLGYITEIVGDAKLAEQHLVNFYSKIPNHIDEITGNETNIWCQLQRLAKKHLELFDKTIKQDELAPTDLNKYDNRNKFLALMTYDQKQVFCNVYYCGKSTAQLSIELNKPEDLIRIALKQAFIMIKKRIVDIEEYIESGILESFVLGAASEAETRELLYFKDKYPQIQMALQELELDMEHIAQQMAIAPPPHAWDRIEDRINEITVAPKRDIIRFKEYDSRSNDDSDRRRENYIEVAESESTHIRVHKNWKWAFAAVFVLGKIFLACAIYFYLENRQAQERIQELKTELRQPAR